MRTAALLLAAALLAHAEDLPLVTTVDFQPFAAQVTRVLTALDLLGEPLPEAAELRALIDKGSGDVRALQRILDRYCLAGVHINPEQRVKVQQANAKPELIEQGWRAFLVKVHNEAGITAVLAVDSPNLGQLANSSANTVGRKWMDLAFFNKQPMRAHLSGLDLEYRVLLVYSKDAGKREGKLMFDVGQGSQDLGFRSEVDILFTAIPSAKVTFRVLDGDQPTTGSFLIRDEKQRVYPSQTKRLAPDFFFHPQVYRSDKESVALPPGNYTITYGRGPEYRVKQQTLKVTDTKPLTLTFNLERWIDPSKLGWYSGDHHIHAAGCAHYERPTEGVYPEDMMRHVLGEDLKVGSVLTWGPGWYFQKTFFEGKDHKLSTPDNRMHYDVEISGHPSSHTGHLMLLSLKEQDYPGTSRLEDWPTWGLPILKWARRQGAVVGYTHSGWGLAIKENKLLSYEMPPFDGIGANEYIVAVTHGEVDLVSAVDTPFPWELNIWYHSLNAGYRTRISGETDFPCIYGDRVGMGRSYVRQQALDYNDWVRGLKEGRNYASDGKSHLIDFRVNNVRMGAGEDVKLTAPGKVKLSARIAAWLDEQPNEAIRSLAVDKKPYWDVERSRVGNTRTVPVEVVVNGQVVATRNIVADGTLRDEAFEVNVPRSAWVALRILPSSHTNPVWVTVGDQPIRSKKSLEWSLAAVDQCYRQKIGRVRLSEQGEMTAAYEFAKAEYRRRLGEAQDW